MRDKESFFSRLGREPVAESAGLVWKLAAFGAVVSLAFGGAHPDLALAMVAVAGYILEQQARRTTPKPSNA